MTSWPKFTLLFSAMLWLLAWGAIVWHVPIRPRAVLQTSEDPMGFSSDGRTLVTGVKGDIYPTGQIRLWDAKSGQELEVVGEEGTILLPNVVYLGQQDLLLESGMCNAVHRRIPLILYDLMTRHETGVIHLSFSDTDSPSLCFAPDGRTLAVCGGEDPDHQEDLNLIDVATSQVRVHLKRGGYRRLVFSPDGTILPIIDDQPDELLLIDTATGEVRKKVKTDGKSIYPLGFSNDGRKFLAFCFNWQNDDPSQVNVWDLSSDHTMSFEGGSLSTFLPDGEGLATSHNLETIRLIDVVAGRQFAEIHNPSPYQRSGRSPLPIPGTRLMMIPTVHVVNPSPFLQKCGTLLGIKAFRADWDHYGLGFFDTRTGKKTASIVRVGMGDPRISVDGKTLAFSSFDGDETSLEIWDIPPRKPLVWVLGVLAIPSVVTLATFWRWLRPHSQSVS